MDEGRDLLAEPERCSGQQGKAPPSTAHTNAKAARDLALLRDCASVDVRTLTFPRNAAQVYVCLQQISCVSVLSK